MPRSLVHFMQPDFEFTVFPGKETPPWRLISNSPEGRVTHSISSGGRSQKAVEYYRMLQIVRPERNLNVI